MAYHESKPPLAPRMKRYGWLFMWFGTVYVAGTGGYIVGQISNHNADYERLRRASAACENRRSDLSTLDKTGWTTSQRSALEDLCPSPWSDYAATGITPKPLIGVFWFVLGVALFGIGKYGERRDGAD